jgi:hypothetical protein
MLNNEKHIRPDIEGEMDELQRVSQDLKRDEDIDISVDEIINAFENSEEQNLSDDIWVNLENTESNEIEKGDWESVMKVAETYKKTNPKKLKKVIESGEYHRPLIIKLGDRYILVAGNTRLCTAAAMGVNPKVFIAEFDVDSEINEKWSEKYKRSIDCNHPKGFSQRAHCQGRKKRETKEQTGADSSGAFSAPIVNNVIKNKKIYKIPNFDLNEQEEFKEATDASSMGSYDVPLFGKSPKGNKDPLKISGPDSIYKGRAVKDKKFPRFGGPEGIYVKVKEKCKKFPYCNQGNTGALEFISEDKEIKEAIEITSKKYGIPLKEVEKLVLNQIKEIFI